MSLRANQDNIEEMIDSSGLVKLVEGLAEYCSIKADSFEGEPGMAADWDILAARFLNDALHIKDRIGIFERE